MVSIILATAMFFFPAFHGKFSLWGMNYWITVDEHNKGLPDEWYYNNIGGDRGVLNAGDVEYSYDGDSITATVINQSGAWTWGGMWYSLNKIMRSEEDGVDFNAIFGPYILPEYQGQITGVEIVVSSVASSNQDLELILEIKDKNNSILKRIELGKLVPGAYPHTYRVDLDPSEIGITKAIFWVIDHAMLGDSVSVDSIRLKAYIPEANEFPTEEQAFLWTYSWLMGNYVQSTGLVQDRSNFESGVFENVTATAKAAKITYYAYEKGYVSYQDAESIIIKIADTLANKVPRGPSGINNLWPHFTENGGAQIVFGTEWASGDTAYAALDIISALQMLGDPKNQISTLIQFLKDINWQDLLLSDGSISQGYTYDGAQIPYSWIGFGMETVGVNWAYASCTENVAVMGPPPSDNGSGFIDNAHYPVVLSGIDSWNNDWDVYRNHMADKQINWYSSEDHYNAYLSSAGLFGLSAAEAPEAEGTYIAYGTGNHVPPNDGNGEVIVLHYSGMISDIRPDEAKHMWEVLRDKTADFLQDEIVISPLNNMESMRVDESTGECTINYLKGSWNLALQAEGWALMDTDIKNILLDIVYKNTFLCEGYRKVKKYSNVIISSNSFSAGVVKVGTSKMKTFWVTNSGTGILVIGTLFIDGPDASEFSIKGDNCSGQTVDPSGTCKFNVVFSPTSKGSKEANLGIPSNDFDKPILNIQLSGTGTDADDNNCFIATTAYGLQSQSYVMILRDFRDTYLMPNKLGRRLIDFYYKYSPFFADLIAKHKGLKVAVRINLLPLVVFSYSMVHLGPIITMVTFIFIFVLPIFLILFYWRRFRRTRA